MEGREVEGEAREERERKGKNMDQISMKAPNPKYRLYWNLTELIDRRDSQSCWYCIFDRFSLVHLPHFPV